MMQKRRNKTPTFVLRFIVLIILVAAPCSGKAAKAVIEDRQGEALHSVEERAYNRRGDEERKAGGVSQGLHGGEEERTRKKRDGKTDKDRVKKKDTSTRAKKKNKASCILMRQDRIVEQPYDANTVNSRVAANAVQFLKNNLICSRHRCREIQPFSLTVSFSGPKETQGPGRAAAMQELDTNVGTVMSALRHLALDDSTLVILTSAAPDRFSADLSEAPFRVPLFARWRTFIEPGTACHHPVDLLDIYPTVAALANVFEGILPDFDGKNLMPLLFTDSHDLIDEVDEFRERVLFHHCGPVLIGTTIGEHTMMVETGGRASVCSGIRHNPPYYISKGESAVRFTLDSPGAGKPVSPWDVTAVNCARNRHSPENA
eukprot:g1228.t1